MAHEHRRSAAAVVAALAALLLAAPSPDAAWSALAGAGSSTDPTGPLVAAVALLAWAVAGWLALIVAVVLLSRLPGLLGRTARALARQVAPATVRRAVEAALGLTVAVGVLAPTTAGASPLAGPSSAVVAESGWDLDWPSRTTPTAADPGPPPTVPVTSTPTVPVSAPSARPPSATPSPAALPSPSLPTSLPAAGPPSGRLPADPPPKVRPARTDVPPAAAGATASTVVVRVGDSLWAIAEASLRSAGGEPTDRQVAQAWPRWWAANREAVGDDPDLLRPGTVLRPPAPTG